MRFVATRERAGLVESYRVNVATTGKIATSTASANSTNAMR
jgi:hypothetical protein